MATFFVSMITLALNGIPGQQVPAASGLYNFLRITAGSFAASVVTTTCTWSAALGFRTRPAEVMDSHDPAFAGTLQKLQSGGPERPAGVGGGHPAGRRPGPSARHHRHLPGVRPS